MHYRYYWRERIIREKVMKYSKPGAAGCFEFVGDLIRCGSFVYCKAFNDLWAQPIKDTNVCKISGLETTPLDYCSKAERIKE